MTVLKLEPATAAAILLADDVSPTPSCAAAGLRELRAQLANANGLDVDQLKAAATSVIYPEIL